MEYLIITINREVKKRKQTNKTDALVQTEMVTSNGLISSVEFSH